MTKIIEKLTERAKRDEKLIRKAESWLPQDPNYAEIINSLKRAATDRIEQLPAAHRERYSNIFSDILPKALRYANEGEERKTKYFIGLVRENIERLNEDISTKDHKVKLKKQENIQKHRKKANNRHPKQAQFESEYSKLVQSNTPPRNIPSILSMRSGWPTDRTIRRWIKELN